MTTGQTSGSTCAPSSFSLFSFKPWESQVKGRLSRELFTWKINLVGQNTCVSQWLFLFSGVVLETHYLQLMYFRSICPQQVTSLARGGGSVPSWYWRMGLNKGDCFPGQPIGKHQSCPSAYWGWGSMHQIQVSCPQLYEFSCYVASRAVWGDPQSPHLIYTVMGGPKCFSYIGRVNSGSGQYVNLGSPECLTVGRILHETLHALGLPFYCKLIITYWIDRCLARDGKVWPGQLRASTYRQHLTWLWT